MSEKNLNLVRIDDELLERARARARKENVSLTRLLNRALRIGLDKSPQASGPKRARFRQKTHAFGAPRVALDKALALAAVLEDEEVAREMALRK